MKQALPPCCTAMPLAAGMRGEQKLPTRNFSFPCSHGEDIKLLLPPSTSTMPYTPVCVAKHEQEDLVNPTYYYRNKVSLTCSYRSHTASSLKTITVPDPLSSLCKCLWSCLVKERLKQPGLKKCFGENKKKSNCPQNICIYCIASWSCWDKQKDSSLQPALSSQNVC